MLLGNQVIFTQAFLRLLMVTTVNVLDGSLKPSKLLFDDLETKPEDRI